MKTNLSVNINKIATLRNSRGGHEPHLLSFAHKIVSYGVQGITIHPRADRRHITPQDAVEVAREITSVETNFEGDLREEFLEMVFRLRPTQCTLVPVKPGEITSGHGWETQKWDFLLEPTLKRLKELGIRTSLFVEVGKVDILERAKEIGTDRVEFYTEPFASAFETKKDLDKELRKIQVSAEACAKLNIGVNAGHDLTYENMPLLKEAVPNLLEVSIGHHLVSYALDVGMEKAVKTYLDVMG